MSGENRGVPQFHSQQQAKEYLAGRIVAEAFREGAPLSEIERKMLYFSETDWAPPGILEVSAEFERDYDNDEYEEKIAGLISNLRASATPAEQQMWRDAVIKLKEGDHYLLVLIDQARSSDGGSGRWFPSANPRGKRPPGDVMRLILVALAISFVLFLVGILLAAGHRH